MNNKEKENKKDEELSSNLNNHIDEELIEDEFAKEKRLKVACYIRVSTEQQDKMFWKDAQLSRIKNYLLSRKEKLVFAWKKLDFWDEFVFYEDIGWASTVEERQELTRLFDMLEYSTETSRPFDLVIVSKIDRFARNLRLLLEVVDRLWQYKDVNWNWVWFISTQEAIDTSSPFWVAMLWIMWVFAELERDIIKERTHGGIKEAREQGIPKAVPYWYRKNSVSKLPEIYEEEAKIVRYIFDTFISWSSVADICRNLSSKKILIPSASWNKSNLSRTKDIYTWDSSTVKWILENEFYIWEFYYNKFKSEKINWKYKTIRLPKSEWTYNEDHQHDAIIWKDDFYLVQKLLPEKRWNYSKSEDNYILARLLKCSHCAEHRPFWEINWHGSTSNKKSWWKYYICSWKKTKNKIWDYQCPCMQLWKEDLETLVLSEIKLIFKNIDTLEKYLKEKKKIPSFEKQKDEKLNAINKKLELANNRLGITKILWEKEWEMSPKEFKTKYEKIEGEIEKLNSERLIIIKTMNKLVNTKSYQKSFVVIKELLEKNLEELFEDNLKTKSLLELLIDEIWIYSREKEEWEVFPWRKTEWIQMIPCKMRIKFRLPQEFLKEYFRGNFKN